MKKLLIILAVSFLSGSITFAQEEDENLGSEDIIVVKDYEARIADAKKVNVNPSIPEIEVEKVSLDYNLPSRLMSLNYPAHQLRPYSMPKLKDIKYKHSYVKLGFGTQFSPLAELMYINKDVKNLTFGGYYRHFSAYGQKRENQKFRDNKLNVFTNYVIKNFEIGAEFDFRQDVDYFYGYNQEDTSFTAKEVMHRVRDIGGKIYLKNSKLNKKNVDHKQTISTLFTNDNFNVNEWFVNYDLDVTKVLKNKHFFNVNGNVDISNYIPSAPGRGDLEREIFQFGGGYTFNNDDWKLNAGIIFAVGDINDQQQFNVYPKIYSEKRLYKNHLLFYTGWSRRLIKNTYAEFVKENPYINYDIMLENSRVEDRMAGFKGAYKGFTYNARFSNKVVKQLPLYVNDSTDMKRFDIVYDKNTTVINVNLEMGYEWDEKLKSLLTFDLNLYEPDGEAKAWHMPMINTNFSTSYLLKKKVLLRAEIFGVAGAFAKAQNGDAVKIKGMADINIGADYQFTKYLSFFAQLNNLANFKYQKWYNYPTFGFNAMVGVQFRY
ncbi:MAG: TonB-dependent receptor [Chitinophagales bacterium]|nr:TonB-dependent receptor [Chitinophagales bacterium]